MNFARIKRKSLMVKEIQFFLELKNNMMFDNSDGKETAGVVKINHCPTCGRKLV